MEFKDVKELIQMLDDSKLAYFEMESKDGYIKIDKSITRDYISSNLANSISNNSTSNLDYKNKEDSYSKDIFVDEKNKSKENKLKEDKSERENSLKGSDDFEYIKSPIVGSFYRAISPDANPFVKKGDLVSKGDIVCIVEAMKLMNEIVAEFDCEIIDVICEDSQMIEYGQELFKIRRV